MKKIYFVQNKEDETSFFRFLKTLADDVSFYKSSFINKKWIYTRVNFSHMSSANYQDRYIYIGKNFDSDIDLCADDFGIKIVMPDERYYHWMFGYVVLYDDPSDKSLVSEIFCKIVKFIKKEYVLSTDKKYYIGAGVYNDWINYKVDTQLMFSYRLIKTDNSTFSLDDFKKYVETCGYTMKGNGLDMRCVCEPDGIEEYVIFSDNCSLKTITTARRVFYTPNSQCVFMNLRHRKQLEFIIDNRLLLGSCEDIVRLKNNILKYFSISENAN